MPLKRHMSFMRGVERLLLIGLLLILADTVVAQPVDPCAEPANPIVAENCLAGTDAWRLEQPAPDDIEGFAYPPSVDKGEQTTLYVNTSAPTVDLRVYRSGYYGGLGGRLMLAEDGIPAPTQPACHTARYDTGLVSCANWTPTFTLDIPADWVSGVYIVHFTRQDTGGTNSAVFVVRDDARPADLLFQHSLFTYQAYSNYGGKSLYDYNSGWDTAYCNTVSANPRGVAVSLFRPLTGGGSNVYQHPEFPLVYWLEQQGYDVSYQTNLDTHADGQAGAQNRLLNHRAFLMVGHDEYWTQAMRDAITAARDAGVHLGNFSSNTGYWRVRLEDDPWTGDRDSVIVTYKTTEAGVPDPSGQPTGTFRDPAGVNAPENALLGVQYIGDNDAFAFPLRITHETGGDRIYRHTDLQTLPPGTFVDVGTSILGWEWDAVADNGLTPPGLDILAATPVIGFLLQDAGDSAQGAVGLATAHVTRYIAESGAHVFAVGTNQWGWGLGRRAEQAAPVDAYRQQITVNMLADMDAQPATPVSEIVLDSAPGRIVSEPERVRRLDAQTPPVIGPITVDPASDLLESGRSVTVTWTTDMPTAGQVWLGQVPLDAHIPIAHTADGATTHQVTIPGLVAGATYRLRVAAYSADGPFALSDEMTFTTPPNLIHAVGSPVLRGWRSLECWSADRPLLAAGAGVGGGLLLIGLLGYGRRLWRRLT